MLIPLESSSLDSNPTKIGIVFKYHRQRYQRIKLLPFVSYIRVNPLGTGHAYFRNEKSKQAFLSKHCMNAFTDLNFGNGVWVVLGLSENEALFQENGLKLQQLGEIVKDCVPGGPDADNRAVFSLDFTSVEISDDALLYFFKLIEIADVQSSIPHEV